MKKSFTMHIKPMSDIAQKAIKGETKISRDSFKACLGRKPTEEEIQKLKDEGRWVEQ